MTPGRDGTGFLPSTTRSNARPPEGACSLRTFWDISLFGCKESPDCTFVRRRGQGTPLLRKLRGALWCDLQASQSARPRGMSVARAAAPVCWRDGQGQGLGWGRPWVRIAGPDPAVDGRRSRPPRGPASGLCSGGSLQGDGRRLPCTGLTLLGLGCGGRACRPAALPQTQLAAAKRRVSRVRSTAARVAAPTVPSTTRPAARWKRMSATAVLGPR